ncbi:hypothetical protein HOD88_02425 [archaeon]|jgi:hypothetical protein|nr:hypothetical protein [archaeon]
MAELAIGQLIKIILGILVVVVVIIGIGFFFKDTVLDFFRNFTGGSTELVLSLLK